MDNFSDLEIPDDALLYLALGSGFIPTAQTNVHDEIFDAKEFCRKLSWRAYHHDKETKQIIAQGDGTKIAEPCTDDDAVKKSPWSAEKLQLGSNIWPMYSDKLLDDIISDIKYRVNDMKTPRIRSNLTYQEHNGLVWCKKMVRQRLLYISRVDKGGSIIVLNAKDVEDIIESHLNDPAKYNPLESDPRTVIRSDIVEALTRLIEDGVFTTTELHSICGITENGGYSHHPDFQISMPYCYPLFKIHKLSKAQIAAKIIPPTRLVTSGTNGPTYRLEIFLENILNPVVEGYCQGEIIKGTTDFLQYLAKQDSSELPENLAGIDVDALYPNIRRDLLHFAVEDALRTSSNHNEAEITAILELISLCLENSIVHYRDSWYNSKDGVPTGGTNSGNLANIYVKWILDKRILIHPKVAKHNKGRNGRARFLDDIFQNWYGTQEDFGLFLEAINDVGREMGFTVKGECGRSIVNLDVRITLDQSKYTTVLHTKPTDSKRYINRKSYHSRHTFKATPYSQFRRAVLICSNSTERVDAINYMIEKFLNSGYKLHELLVAKIKALSLDRTTILGLDGEMKNSQSVTSSNESKTINFVINQNPRVRKSLTSILDDRHDDIIRLVGDTRVIISEKNHPSTEQLLFGKSSFSKTLKFEIGTQPCGA